VLNRCLNPEQAHALAEVYERNDIRPKNQKEVTDSLLGSDYQSMLNAAHRKSFSQGNADSGSHAKNVSNTAGRSSLMQIASRQNLADHYRDDLIAVNNV